MSILNRELRIAQMLATRYQADTMEGTPGKAHTRLVAGIQIAMRESRLQTHAEEIWGLIFGGDGIKDAAPDPLPSARLGPAFGASYDPPLGAYEDDSGAIPKSRSLGDLPEDFDDSVMQVSTLDNDAEGSGGWEAPRLAFYTATAVVCGMVVAIGWALSRF